MDFGLDKISLVLTLVVKSQRSCKNELWSKGKKETGHEGSWWQEEETHIQSIWEQSRGTQRCSIRVQFHQTCHTVYQDTRRDHRLCPNKIQQGHRKNDQRHGTSNIHSQCNQQCRL